MEPDERTQTTGVDIAGILMQIRQAHPTLRPHRCIVQSLISQDGSHNVIVDIYLEKGD